MILHQIASKLSNVFNKHCADPITASAEAQPIIEELYESLGGCDLCFGRGYNMLMEICTCDRGKQLQGFIKNQGQMPELHPPDQDTRYKEE